MLKEQGLPTRPHYFWPLLTQHLKDKNTHGMYLSFFPTVAYFNAIFSTCCVHVLRQTFPTSFSMVMIVKDRFRNTAFVFLVMNRGLCDRQYQRELSKECFLSNINAL